jgi:[acyl-carrier-protein] S-malonyltransferase
MSTILLFPGQASQYVGMGADLHARHELARRMYAQANKILECDIARISFEGPQDLLVQTVYTQPAIFVHSCVMFALASKAGMPYAAVAGHSLGEYSALVAAGVLSFEDGLTAVKHRSRSMQEACEANPGTMAAVLGLRYDAVVDLCARASGQADVVVAANYNREDQVVISGTTAGIRTASGLASGAGAKRVIPLAVGGAFHSPLMHPAPEQMARVLDRLHFRHAQCPVVLNVTGEPETDPEIIKGKLIEQLVQPVLWYPTMLWLQSLKPSRIVEVGPKKVLLGLAKGLFPDATAHSLDLASDLDVWQLEAAVAPSSR